MASDESLSVESSPSNLVNASTRSLARALYGRNYTWETLRSAGLRFTNFSATELLWWLRHDRQRFRLALQSTALGLGLHTSTELLEELSHRNSIKAARNERETSPSLIEIEFDVLPVYERWARSTSQASVRTSERHCYAAD